MRTRRWTWIGRRIWQYRHDRRLRRRQRGTEALAWRWSTLRSRRCAYGRSRSTGPSCFPRFRRGFPRRSSQSLSNFVFISISVEKVVSLGRRRYSRFRDIHLRLWYPIILSMPLSFNSCNCSWTKHPLGRQSNEQTIIMSRSILYLPVRPKRNFAINIASFTSPISKRAFRNQGTTTFLTATFSFVANAILWTFWASATDAVSGTFTSKKCPKNCGIELESAYNYWSEKPEVTQ